MKKLVDWRDFENASVHLASQFRGVSVDLIVGVGRGGLPLAVHLSHLLDCRNFGAVLARKTTSNKAFDFKDSNELELSPLLVMNDPDSEIRTVLVAEDVVSRGDVLTNVEKLLRTTFGPSITVFKVVLFADKARIRANENSTLLENFHCFSEFDQASTWIVFPWETR